MAGDAQQISASKAHATRAEIGGKLATTEVSRFEIGGMHCAACATRTERALRSVPGVVGATVNFALRSARVEFDPAKVSERALHDAVVASGYQVLSREFARENKAHAEEELRRARIRAFAALALTAPVAVLAMLEIALPLGIAGRNLSVWLQAALSSIVVLGLGWEFHRGMARRAVRLDANMDTLISLGTLSALAYSWWGLRRR